jgi:hypothetical protein
MNQPIHTRSAANTPLSKEALPVETALKNAQKALKEAVSALQSLEKTLVIPSIYEILARGDYKGALDTARYGGPPERKQILQSVSLLYKYLKRFEEHANIILTENTRNSWIQWRGIKALFNDFCKKRSFHNAVTEVENFALKEIGTSLRQLEALANTRRIELVNNRPSSRQMLVSARDLHQLLTEYFSDFHHPFVTEARSQLKQILTDFINEKNEKSVELKKQDITQT